MALQLFTGFQDPFFTDFERSLSRAFQPVFDLHRDVERASRKNGQMSSPYHPTDILEYKDKYSIVADTPGMTPDDITVELKGNTLVVSGEKSTQKDVMDDQAGVKVRRSERTFNKFTRSFVLPEDVRMEGIAARVENGVLTLDIPKEPREAARTEAKRIRVTGGAAPAQIGGTNTPPQTSA